MLAEKEACLRLKGENGLLRKKFDEQQKAIDDARAALRGAEGDKRQLHVVGRRAGGRGWREGGREGGESKCKAAADRRLRSAGSKDLPAVL